MSSFVLRMFDEYFQKVLRIYALNLSSWYNSIDINIIFERLLKGDSTVSVYHILLINLVIWTSDLL